MFYLTRRKTKELVFCGILLCLLNYFGAFTHLFETDFNKDFHYPYDGDIEEFVQQMRSNITPKIAPINSYNYQYYKNCESKCKGISSLRLVYLIKSAPEHFDNRLAIRNSWGYEHRFSDVEIRTVFLLGVRINDSNLQSYINKESQQYHDIIQGNFTDSYFNNTLKTMMGFKWAVQFCANARFFMFVDDDYYVSTKNVLRFIRNPTNYPKYIKMFHKNSGRRMLKQYDFDLDKSARLYSGYAFNSAPHRHYSSKWYVSLEDYPYHMWPPYITAGAYVLSREALIDMYYASFYTKHFKFDDIYVALLAFKTKIEPFHCEEFYYYKLDYNPKSYEYVVATHGYGDFKELMEVWTQQKGLGNA